MQPCFLNHLLVSQPANDYDVPPTTPDAVTLPMLKDWFINRLAEYTGMAPEDIDSRETCTVYGIDSIAGVSLVGDLEMWLNLQLSPTLLWHHDSLDSLCQHVMTMLEHAPDAPTSSYNVPLWVADSKLGLNETEQLIAELDNLTEAEVDAMLHRLLAA